MTEAGGERAQALRARPLGSQRDPATKANRSERRRSYQIEDRVRPRSLPCCDEERSTGLKQVL